MEMRAFYAEYYREIIRKLGFSSNYVVWRPVDEFFFGNFPKEGETMHFENGRGGGEKVGFLS